MLIKPNVLKRSAVVELIRAVLADKRPHLADKFTRIDKDYFPYLERELQLAIERRIMAAPTVGKTLH